MQLFRAEFPLKYSSWSHDSIHDPLTCRYVRLDLLAISIVSDVHPKVKLSLVVDPGPLTQDSTSGSLFFLSHPFDDPYAALFGSRRWEIITKFGHSALLVPLAIKFRAIQTVCCDSSGC